MLGSESIVDEFNLIGRTLKTGKYKIVGTIGKGGFAIVYEGLDSIGNKVAIKILSETIVAGVDLVQRFIQEAKNLASFRQTTAHIITILDYGTEEIEGGIVIHYYVMPYIEKSLRELTGERISNDLWLKIAHEICEALEIMHGKNFIHRDIKPENILLDEGNNCILSDFGLVREQELATRTTSRGWGTPIYMSPEQEAGRPLDSTSDIYSLGVVLFELASGERPSSRTPSDLKKQLAEIPQRNKQELILKCLQPDKRKRHQSVEALKLDLTKLNEETILIAPKRNGIISIKIIASFIVLIGLIAAIIFIPDIKGITELFNPGGYIYVDSNPQGALISVDGKNKELGTPKLLGPLKAGAHTVMFSLDDYQSLTKEYRVSKNDTIEDIAQLVPIATTVLVGMLKLQSTPEGASIYLDNKLERSKTSTTIDSLFEGTHEIRIEKSGYKPIRDTIQIISGELLEKSYTLDKLNGMLYVNSTPQGASIFVNDRSTGQRTPYLFKEVDIGKNTVRLTKECYLDKTDEINVIADGQSNADLTLMAAPPGTLRVSAVVRDANNVESGIVAEVWIDGQKRRQTPFTEALPCGTHQISAQLFNYTVLGGEQTMKIESQESKKIKFVFEKN